MNVERAKKRAAILRLAGDMKSADVIEWLLGELAKKSPLGSYMTAETTPARDAAFLRTYAERILNKTETTWEIPHTRATTLRDIADRIEGLEEKLEGSQERGKEYAVKLGRLEGAQMVLRNVLLPDMATFSRPPAPWVSIASVGLWEAIIAKVVAPVKEGKSGE
jgi:hypothetical protein